MSNAIANALSQKVWEEHEPIPEDELIEKARKRLDSSLAAMPSVIAVEALSVLHIIPTSAVDTLAVTLLPDGFSAQLFNPEFTLSLRTDRDLAFVRTHEMYHLLMRHLWGDREIRDGVYEMAQEAVINERVQRLMMPHGTTTPPSKREMPFAWDKKKGTYEEVGVKPYTVFERYRKDLKEQGLDPAEWGDFFSSDVRCYAELKRMKKDPLGGKKFPPCETGQASQGGGGQDPNGNPQPTMDPGQAQEIVEDTLEKVIRQASANDRAGKQDNRPKREISDLMDMPDQSDEVSTMWGDLGANQLRGKATETRKVEFWKQYLQSALHTRLVPGERLIYNSARWWEPSLSRKGEEETQKVLIAVDTSGSMLPGVLDYIVELLGDEDDLELIFCCFDMTVRPFELGDTMTGGGGTSIKDLERYIEEDLENDVDAVVCITDGYFDPVPPREDADKWIMLCTPNGDLSWADAAGMEVYDLDMDYAA